MDDTASDHDALEEKLDDPTASPIPLQFAFLEDITRNFSKEQELGRGGYGVVYKGVLRSGKSIAVKRLFENLVNDEKLQKEVSNLFEIKHQNIVQLIGYCAESRAEATKLPDGKYVMAQIPRSLLCFEYLDNMSLDKHISDESCDLDWDKRYKIIKGICSGLHFLHGECHIVHLDLKPENILMDGAMMPKIADFGLSKLLGAQKSRTIVSGNVAGSLGYMAPEYLWHGVVSPKADIFSFGVIIIEIITGVKEYPMSTVPCFQEFNENGICQSPEASLKKYRDNVIGRWMDVLKEQKHTSLEIYAQQIEQCVTIALECLNYDPTRRPTGCDISQMLTGELCGCQKKTLLSTQPYLLRFHFTRNYEVTSCPLQLTNNTDETVAFRIVTSDREKHFPWPVHGLVLPRSMSTLRVALYRPLEGDIHFRIKLESTITDEQYHLPDVQGSSSYEYNCLFTEAKNKGREVQQVKLLFVIAHEVLERDSVMNKFEDVIVQLELALYAFQYSELVISDEVREQVELLHAQLTRAKEKVDMPDDEFCNDLLSLFNKSCDPSAEPAILERLSEKLHMMTMVSSGDDQDPGKHIDKMSRLLKKIKDFMQTQNADSAPPIGLNLMDSNRDPRPLSIPDEFRCPISLELMKDPVIVATGQTYERVCIEKWLASGHCTCPTTQQMMANTALIPNYGLRSLIAQWCKANKIEPQNLSSQPNKPTSACTSRERANIDAFVSKLCSPDLKEQRSAAAELRLLAKSTKNRIYIGEAGAIPFLLSLLSSSDLRTQEHAVTAILNLSIHEDNKIRIIFAGALPSIVRVLENGSMEARENAAATLFSLSVVDENKIIIGESGAIPALVVLLSEGSLRGKKDAAAVLFNLCIYQGNKGWAVRAGLVTVLMGLVTDPTAALVDEALATLSILSSHPEGKAAIGAAEPVPMLVGMIESSTPRNRENAAAVMLQLCSDDKQLVHLARANECGIMVPLQELAENGTERGKRKAGQLLERMRRFLTLQASAEVLDQVSDRGRRNSLQSLKQMSIILELPQEQHEAQMQASAQALAQDSGPVWNGGKFSCSCVFPVKLNCFL